MHSSKWIITLIKQHKMHCYWVSLYPLVQKTLNPCWFYVQHPPIQHTTGTRFERQCLLQCCDLMELDGISAEVAPNSCYPDSLVLTERQAQLRDSLHQ